MAIAHRSGVESQDAALLVPPIGWSIRLDEPVAQSQAQGHQGPEQQRQLLLPCPPDGEPLLHGTLHAAPAVLHCGGHEPSPCCHHLPERLQHPARYSFLAAKSSQASCRQRGCLPSASLLLLSCW
jgi:hypothetical protein